MAGPSSWLSPSRIRPPPENTRFQETFSHTYDEAGAYTATFAYNVGADCSFSPYRSTGEASITVPVG